MVPSSNAPEGMTCPPLAGEAGSRLANGIFLQQLPADGVSKHSESGGTLLTRPVLSLLSPPSRKGGLVKRRPLEWSRRLDVVAAGHCPCGLGHATLDKVPAVGGIAAELAL